MPPPSLPQLPPRPNAGHKGTFGRVLIVGGSEEMIGAPTLAGTAALRMGAGLVQIAVPKSIINACLTITPELIALGLGKTGKDGLLSAAEAADALVVGPGMGQSPESAERLDRLIRIEKPMVLDADGLNLLAKEKKWPKDFAAKAVLTPHPGEMGRLIKLMGKENVPTDDAGRMEIARQAASSFGQTVVLKGHRTVVTDGQRNYINQTGDSTLSKAGAGDVLSGIIGCLLGQQMSGFDAACLGVFLHGRAGELAGAKLGKRCALARDVLGMLPTAISEIDR
jgi:NAD(P)H-hydrate epimerase